MKYQTFFITLFSLLIINRIELIADTSSKNFPKSIVSLSPIVTENIYLLEAEDRLVANTIYCVKPEKAKYIRKIGTLVEVNLEKLITLKPDLVIATELAKPNQLKMIEKFGIKVVQFSRAKCFDDICKQFHELACLIGQGKKALEIITKEKKIAEKYYSITQKIDKKRIFFQIGARPIHTVNTDSFINDYIRFSGGINIALNESSGIYSREKVIKLNPEFIFITTMGIIGEKEKQTWMKFSSIDAVKNHRIYILNSEEICAVTPVSFIRALKNIAAIIHPDVFTN